MPKRVMFAWELGQGLGHIDRLAAIARDLITKGYEPIFCLRSPDVHRRLFSVSPSARTLPAPAWRLPFDYTRLRVAHDYADVLFMSGYDAPQHLESIVQGWLSIFSVIKPALLVCDHSPTAVFAASGKFPVIHVGSGFATPPVGKPFLPLANETEAGAKARKTQVLTAINEVATKYSLPSLVSITDILSPALQVTCALPELDPYQTVRHKQASGPIRKLPLPLSRPSDRLLFGYLDGLDQRILHIVQEIINSNNKVELYIRNCSVDIKVALQRENVYLYDTPPQLAYVAQRASGIIHHGGLSTTEYMLAVGRPQLFLPAHLEQQLTADAAASLGCGFRVDQKADFIVGLTKLFNSEKLQQASECIAAVLEQRKQENVLEEILEQCIKHLH